MTLDEELQKKGFGSYGPVKKDELEEAFGFLLNKSPQPVYIKAIQGKIVRNDMDKYPDLYMIYYTSNKELALRHLLQVFPAN